MAFKKVHCFFEQSGTFKNEFIKLGIPAFDYDLANDFHQVDYQIDLFTQIHKAFYGGSSVFDDISQEDLIFAFFPCTFFSCQSYLAAKCDSYQMQSYSDLEKLNYSRNRVRDISRFYSFLCMLCHVCIEKKFPLIVENPVSQPHFLTSFFPFKPGIVHNDRSLYGDFYKKPTQYFIFNFEPNLQFVFEPAIYHDVMNIERAKHSDDKSRAVIRSMISSDYANRFIKMYLL